MSALTIQVTLAGMGEVDMILHELRNSLANRGPMHAVMAVRAQEDTQEYLRSDDGHRTAQRLGGKPTGWRAQNAAAVTAQSDPQEGRVIIPRSTGLGRAFHNVVIRPGSGKTYLTLAGHQETYGRSVRDFPEDTFRFAVIQSWRTFVVLVFRETSGRHEKGEVGYWLKREVEQKQDRTLLPSDERYAKVARAGAVEYLTEVLKSA